MKTKHIWTDITGLVHDGIVKVPTVSLNAIFNSEPSDEIEPHELLRKIRTGMVTPPRQDIQPTQEEVLNIGRLLDSGLGISEVALVTQRNEGFIAKLCEEAYYPHIAACLFPEADSSDNKN